MTAASLAEFFGAYQAPRLSTRITARADLLARVEQLHRDYKAAQRADAWSNQPDTAPAIWDALQAVRDKIEASEFEFTFEALGRARYRELLMSPGCRPTPAQAKEGADFNPEVFPIELIAECSAEPKLSRDDVRALFEKLTDNQFEKLWMTALAVNIGDDTAPKSLPRSVEADSSETSSSTADPAESLDPSSLDE